MLTYEATRSRPDPNYSLFDAVRLIALDSAGHLASTLCPYYTSSKCTLTMRMGVNLRRLRWHRWARSFLAWRQGRLASPCTETMVPFTGCTMVSPDQLWSLFNARERRWYITYRSPTPTPWLRRWSTHSVLVRCYLTSGSLITRRRVGRFSLFCTEKPDFLPGFGFEVHPTSDF